MTRDKAANDIHGITISGYTPQRPRVSTAPPIDRCGRCVRPTGQTHADWCPERESDRPTIGPSLVEWVQQRKAVAAAPPPAPVIEPELDDDGEPIKICAVCAEPLPPGKRKVCSSICVSAAKRRKMAAKRAAATTQRKEPTVTSIATLPTKTYPLSVLDGLADTAVCKICGPASRDRFATRKDGSPKAICRKCAADQLSNARAARKQHAPHPAEMPQAVAEAAYAAIVEQPEPLPVTDPEDMIPTKPVARFLPEPAVIDLAAPAPMPAEPSGNPGQLPPIEDEIAELEARLNDLRDIRTLMGDTMTGLLRWQRLVGEAIARKQAELGVSA